MTPSILAEISETLRKESGVEGIVRRFLSLIQITTGLDSTYLTQVDLGEGRQIVLFATNTGALIIPEGLTVPWGDTLCKRALDENCPFASDVPVRWPESAAARLLGIQTYVSTPVVVGQQFFGTLCGASTGQTPLDERSRDLLTLFGEIIALYIEKERMMETLTQLNHSLAEASLTDALTGLPNRRFMMAEATRLFSIADRTGQDVLVAFVDLDDFKHINDTFGHEAGDEFLVAIGRRLTAMLRQGDVAGRIGGDEFLVLALAGAEPKNAAATLSGRLKEALAGTFPLSTGAIDYAGPSIGVVALAPRTVSPQEAIRQADSAMYAAKLARKSRGAG